MLSEQVIPEFEQPIPLDRLVGETTIPEELSARQIFESPQPEAVVPVVSLAPLDPAATRFGSVHLRIEPAGLRVAEHGHDIIEIVVAKLPESEPFGRRRK
jgi:hypothetical protein